MTLQRIEGFEVMLDRLYDLEHHMWVEELGGSRLRIGMDSLGLETSGTLSHLAIASEGSRVRRGEAFGSLEAEKYVGPLVSPLSGHVVAVNTAIMDDPGQVQADPYGAGWMIELEPENFGEERSLLIGGKEAIVTRFGQKVTEYKLEGVLAE